MARRLFFVDGVRRGHAELRGEEARHLTRVLRVERGQVYEISDNARLYLAEVEAAHKEEVSFRVIEELQAGPPEVRITLYASLIRFERFEMIVEKATELGAETLTPVQASRSEKGLECGALKRLARWRKIALESSQQSRRWRMPEICPPARFEDVVRAEADHRLILDEAPGACPLLASLQGPLETGASVAALLGPEGGWTEEERSAAIAAGWSPVSLGPHVLRSETAAAAALSILQAAWQAQ